MTCLPPVSITAVPDGKLHAPYFMQWSFALEQQVGNNSSARPVRGHARGESALTTQVNGYQTVCQGCFAPIPLWRATDPRFGAVTQLSTGANSHYNGLQLTAEKRLAHGFRFRRTIPGAAAWTPSRTAASCRFPRPEFFRHCPVNSVAITDLAITMSARISMRNMSTIAVESSRPLLGAVLNGWQVSGTAFFHTGLPFSVLSAPYTANGNGIVQGSGPQYASVVPGVSLYDHNPIPGVTQPGTMQWLNPDAFVSTVDPSTGACMGGESPRNCQFGNLGRNALRGPDFFGATSI